ncbi:hypothetical protein SESBI_07934 [Sesbania bispinosa]|nr:hypothetical protein SESBI_07934 [Sesbania bispinosa]
MGMFSLLVLFHWCTLLILKNMVRFQLRNLEFLGFEFKTKSSAPMVNHSIKKKRFRFDNSSVPSDSNQTKSPKIVVRNTKDPVIRNSQEPDHGINNYNHNHGIKFAMQIEVLFANRMRFIDKGDTSEAEAGLPDNSPPQVPEEINDKLMDMLDQAIGI